MEEKSLNGYMKKSFTRFVTAIVNIFIFLPYYFSVTSLLKTLFRPWKNLVAAKQGVGFSFEEWFSRLSFNLLSRFIGVLMRLTIVGSFVVIISFYALSIPFLFLLFFISFPLRYLMFSSKESETQKKNRLRESFLKSHLMNKENLDPVLRWFEVYYHIYHVTSDWWLLDNLLSIPPMARGWAAGFTPTLDQYASELTSTSYQAHMKHALDREREIEMIETELTKNQGGSVVIVGEAGIGKHTIIDALSKKIYEGSINPILTYKRVLKLNLEKILTQVTDQKQREALVESLFEEAIDAQNIILMIENLDKYVASTVDRVNLATSIEKYGKTPSLHFIGTTTPFAYQKFIFTNDQIAPLFTKIDIAEVDKISALEILLEKALLFEVRNQVIIPYETVKDTIEKSDFFITRTPFPEKAIELLDSVVAHVTEAKQSKDGPVIILPDTVDTILSETMHVPTQLNADLKHKLVDLETYLSSRILYQTEAVEKLSAALRRSFLFLGKRKKPLANFLFLGPTGVGKTETAKALSELFFGSEKNMLRFDMSLYQSKDDISKLIGSEATENPGILTEAVRQTPFGVLLLDEIEKANKDLLNIFLTILDEGYFTDGMGRRVDCKNLIIVATSNAGSDYIFSNMTLNTESSKQKNTSENLMNYLIEQKYFAPEFLNRFDGVIAYQPLNEQTVLELGKRITGKISENYLKQYKIKVFISDQTLAEVVHKGYHPQFGARDLERVVTSELEDKIAKQILSDQIHEGQEVTL